MTEPKKSWWEAWDRPTSWPLRRSPLPPCGWVHERDFHHLSFQGWHEGLPAQRSRKVSRRAGLEIKPGVWAVLRKLGFCRALGF